MVSILEKYTLDENGIKFVRETSSQIANPVSIDIGSEQNYGGQKAYTEVCISEGEKERYAGKYVVKDFKSRKEALEELEKCLRLESIGIPVPGVHRLGYDVKSNKYSIIYSDLSLGFKNRVWSVNNGTEELREMGISKEVSEQLITEIGNIANLASVSGYSLNFDSYFIVRGSNGKFNIVIGDLGIGISKENTINRAEELNYRNIKVLERAIRKSVTK